MKNKDHSKDKLRLAAMIVVSIFVIVSGALFAYETFMHGDIAGGILSSLIALAIIGFALFVFIKGNKDMKKGFPLKDERSRRVMEKASSAAFYISLYLLLAIGFVSDSVVHFRDVSQATSVGVGGMAFLFLLSWLYYNNKEI